MITITAEQAATILIVDAPDAAALLRKPLVCAGYTVSSAQSGPEAIDAAATSQPDLVLLDMGILGTDCYEVCRRLREHEATQAIPIIVLTSQHDRADKLRALDNGADDFLSKPVDPAELLARVRSSLRMKRVYDDLARSKWETERQAHELAAEKSRAEALLASMSDGVFMTDTAGRITFLNPAVEHVTGVGLGDCSAQPWYQALAIRSASGKPLDADNCPVLEAMRGMGQLVERDLAIWRADGREIIISLAASPIRSTNQQVDGCVAVFRDVTSAREVQRMQEDFVGLVSHELRTPLSAIYGFAELLLERERLSNTARACVETIYKEADRMTSLVNDFLDIERLASGRMSFHLRSLRLDEIVNEVRADLSGQLSNHSFVVEGPDEPVYVRADRDRLVQIILNLISNAIKYSPDGGQIRVRIESLGRLARVSVTDQGLGLPLTSIPKLFARFYRVEEASHRRVHGTGLGLAICKQIIEAMGGRIWAESPGLGQGSTFSFTIPTSRAPAQTSAEAPVASSGRILLAKDDPALAGLILAQLGPLGFAVEAASSGSEAISHVRSERPAAVVLDVGLPGEPAAWRVLAALREDSTTAETPVVFASGAEGKEYGLALSVDAFMVKPFRSQRLIATLNRLVGGPSDRPVVVADADPMSREVSEQILTGAGYRVITTHDGDSALKALATHDALALVLDLLMPNVDGFGVLDSIRSDERTAGLPVVALTPKELTDEAHRLLDARTAEVLRRSGGAAVNIAAALLRAVRSQPAPTPSAPVVRAAPAGEAHPVRTLAS